MESILKLVVGLGNPGSQYADTRHNVGAQIVADLAGRLGASFKKRESCLVADARIGMLSGGVPGPKITLAIAESFMNVSGLPVAKLARFMKIEPAEILVVHDDLDLPAHELRLKSGGGEGGHNGLKSMSEHLGSRDYSRLRVGIGRPPGRQTPADYVLAKIRTAEKEEWNVTYAVAGDVIEDVAVKGLAATQQELHSRS